LLLRVAHNDNPNTCPSFLSHTMIQKALPDLSAGNVIPDGELIENLRDTPSIKERPPKSTLIEFPRTSRPLPEWRKQLSQRVREVQERKVREAAEELAAAQEAGVVSCALPSGQLELVPDLEQPPMNPIVSKVLERLERARRVDNPLGSSDGALALDAAADNDLGIEAISDVNTDDPKPLETKTKLTIVAPAQTEVETSSRKPVRVIADGVEDAALSYLENCLSIKSFDSDLRNEGAGFGRRITAGILDLLLVALLATPFAALIEFAGAHWADRRTIGFTAGTILFVMFAYLTMTTALVGRTLGMRMLALRTIDMRTGLIPTGGQSIKRAIANILSLGLLGFGLLYGLVDRDGRTIPDRFSKTLVIHD
jgi:uncharacterized RDD family membrane protein YckC